MRELTATHSVEEFVREIDRGRMQLERDRSWEVQPWRVGYYQVTVEKLAVETMT